MEDTLSNQRIRPMIEVICSICGKSMMIRKENYKKHSGRCISCNSKECWKNEEYRNKIINSRLGKPCSKRLAYGEGNLRALLGKYKRDAKLRNLEFSLSLDFFRYITKQNCYYCGIEPLQVRESKKRKSYGEWVYNGIDRKDCSIGYVEDNVVPACKHCNFAKRQMSIEEFYNFITRIYNHSCNI